MDPVKIVGLQASWMTMVAHGVPVPVVFPAPAIAIPSATNREYVESTTTNIVDTVLKIAKEAGGMFNMYRISRHLQESSYRSSVLERCENYLENVTALP